MLASKSASADGGPPVEITPSPRILSVLGEIEIAEWQCLAELIDNSADEIARRNEATSSSDAQRKELSCIDIHLPTSHANSDDAEILVSDRGRGMSIEQLQRAVRAGWTGNDLFDHLGLFGMGFNVATARLGRVTEVLTTRAGDPTWHGVRIDLDLIGEDFEVPDISEPKDAIEDHGTRIRISRLDPDRLRVIASKQEAIRIRLGHVYSWLLSHRDLSIRVNGRLVVPKRHCTWDESRYVIRGRGRNTEQIPAVISIDQKLPDAEACWSCGHWQEIGRGECDHCGSTNVVPRERRIHGWVGIQRYLHTSEYGIDFIRNGRKILTWDKTVFRWSDINDPLGEELFEYPIEPPANMGRIVGEIHLDHVPVDYKKDRFETSSREWKAALTFLRGEGPLRPKSAKDRGYDERNESPIGRLFRGYQENDPGDRCLIPGNGSTAIHAQAAEWGAKFARGDREFQDDTKWWEAVKEHDRIAAARNQPATGPTPTVDEAAVLAALGATDGASEEATRSGGEVQAAARVSTDPPPKTEADRADDLRAEANPIPFLSREYRANGIEDHIEVRAWEVQSSPLLEGTVSGRHAPMWLYPLGGGVADLFIDLRHEAFTKQGNDLLTLVLGQVAFFLGTRRDAFGRLTLPQIVFELRRDSFADANMDFVTVQEACRSALRSIRERLIEEATEDPQRAWRVLNEVEIGQIETIRASGKSPVDSSDSTFIEDVPATYLVRLLEEWPELFTDGRVFTTQFASLTSQSAKVLVKASLTSLLIDCATLAVAEGEAASQNELARTRLSVEILEQRLAAR